jgi:hypothetical protein
MRGLILLMVLVTGVTGCSRKKDDIELPDFSEKTNIFLIEPVNMTAEQKQGLYTHYLLFTDGKKTFWFDLDGAWHDAEYERDQLNKVLQKRGKPLLK